jgi:hypothetical protein
MTLMSTPRRLQQDDVRQLRHLLLLALLAMGAKVIYALPCIFL